MEIRHIMEYCCPQATIEESQTAAGIITKQPINYD